MSRRSLLFKKSGSAPIAGYTLDGIVKVTPSLDINPPLTIPQDVTFNNDGTKVFSCAILQTTIEEWNLPTPYDFTGATKGVSSSAFPSNRLPFVQFNPDGTKLYTQYGNIRDIRQYTCASPYDITNITFEKRVGLINGPVYTSLHWAQNGSSIFMAVQGSNTIQKWNCSIPYDVDGIDSVVFTSFDVTNEMAQPIGVVLSPDGSRMFVSSDTDKKVYEYNLSSNFNLSSPTFIRSITTSGQARGLTWSPDGMNLFVAERFGEFITKYSLP